MSNKPSRHSPAPSSPASPHVSKLPKFLTKNRDRSKSLSDPSGGGGSTSSLVSSASTSPEIPNTPAPKQKKGSKFLGIGKDRDREDKGRRTSDIHYQAHHHQREESALGPHSIGGGTAAPSPAEINEAPVIVEPSSPSTLSIPRPRNARSSAERPLSTASDINAISNHSSLYSSTSSSTSSSAPKFGERLTGWLSSTFTGTPSSDLSIQNILAQAATSPNKTKANPFHGLAKHGRTAMRYILDSDATPDKCPDPIWILGVQHPGWEPNQYQQQLHQLQLQQLQYQQFQVHQPQPPPLPPSSFSHGSLSRRRGSGGSPSLRSSMSSSASTRSDLASSQTSLSASTTTAMPGGLSGSGMGTLTRGSAPPSAYPLSPSASAPGASSSSTSLSLSITSASAPMSPSSSVGSPTSSSAGKDPSANWPPIFYADFTTKIWLTYRSQFPPIRDTSLGDLPDDPMDERLKAGVPGSVVSTPVAKRGPFSWGGGEKGWTSDSGWGCMLRTGQSLLANTLVYVHLGREWRRPPYPIQTADYATYVQIVSWFLDTPSPEAPFSVHRMALAGKELGKDVGQWFGPSTAAGAIQRLVNAFPECGLGVALAVDGTLYQSDVYAASHGTTNLVRSTRRHGKSFWGHKPVLLLLGIRLGLDGVNPIYYSTIKTIYTFPQSVGIAGGRPSSSYYFVGSQADNLFYLDPHHARPSVPLRPAPQVNHSAGAGSNVPVIQQVASMVPIVQQVQQQNGGGSGSLSSSQGHSQSPSQYSHSQSGHYNSSAGHGGGQTQSQYNTMRSKREGTPESDREWGRTSIGKGRPPSSLSNSASSSASPSASYRRSPSPPSNSPPNVYSIHQSLALHHQQHPSASASGSSGSSSSHHYSQSYPSASAPGSGSGSGVGASSGPSAYTQPQPQPQPHQPTPQHYRSTTSPSSIRTGASSTFSYHAPLSPSPLQKEFSTGSTTTGESVAESFVTGTDGTSDSGVGVGGHAVNVQISGVDEASGSSATSATAEEGDSQAPNTEEDDLDVKDLVVNPKSEKEESSGSSHHHDQDASTGGLPASPPPPETASLPPPPAPSPLDELTDHYINAYSSAELKTFHCDKVRKMPLSGLDPSMLIGFLVKDEADWQDLRRRVAELPRQIFSIQEEPPSWPSDSDDNMGLESICEPDDDDEDLLGDDSRDDSLSGDDGDDAELLASEADAAPRRKAKHGRQATEMERSVSSGSGHGVEVLDDDEEEGDDAEEDEDGSEQFFDTQSGSASTSSHGHEDQYQQQSSQQHGRKGSMTDGDTEEDPLDPITPGPGSKFAIGPAPTSTRGSQVLIQVQRSESEGGVGGEAVKVGYEEGNDDIEDDWVDPSCPTPSSPSPTVPSEKEKTKGKERDRERGKEKEKELPRPPLLNAPPPPPMKKSKSGASTGSTGKKKKSSGSKSGGGKSSSSSQIPVPVPMVKHSSRQSSRHQPQPQEHYPFPSEGDGDAEWEKDGEGWEGVRSTGSVGGYSTGAPGSGIGMVNGKRMHTAKARDGGRTQSGGVKGILPDEDAQGRLSAAAADRE
ncbi:hypothetical protein BDN72DRAFT_901537 [Pluteus cervinus]|uniref:Uncharacterized protein n=1 Tax=Pluteus cervinus TaxID=181527 RepID=A0ACD3AF10_9AGAR|nr:hypothetical protein BDN72DRAFT_901537 [Pluteus cervinus]